MTQAKLFAELSADGKWIEVYFAPNPQFIDIMHTIGAKFMSAEKSKSVGTKGAHWRIGLEFESGRQLTKMVGSDNMTLGDALDAWASTEKEIEKEVKEIWASDGNVTLPRLAKQNKKLAEAIHIGPKGKSMTPAERKVALKAPSSFQATDVKFMSFVEHPLNANQPGLGKTIETLASVVESNNEGPTLVVAPKTSLDSVWETELRTWTDWPVIRLSGDGKQRYERYHGLREAELAVKIGDPVWVLVNPDMVRMRKRNRKLENTKENLYSEYPFLHEHEWSNVIIDEAHKGGVRNANTTTAKGMYDLKVKEGGKRYALSGTPLGGKVINYFGILHYLHPDRFTNKYKWANQWLSTTEEPHSKNGATHIEIGDVIEEKQDEFDRHLMRYVVRRTKAEVIPDLPPIDHVDVWCTMTEAQAEQYKKFAQMAQIELGDDTLSATSVLAIYTRLKQFASAKQRFEDGVLIPTNDSGKLEELMARLDELGIFDADNEAQTVIGSQFVKMVDMVYDELVAKGVPVLKITGETKMRGDAVRSFQNGEAKVMLLQTDTGGVSITLDRADTVHILDEKWNPDDQEQLEDRVHRASRIHQVTSYYYRSKGTLEEYIKEVTDKKGRVNKRTLDERRIRLY